MKRILAVLSAAILLLCSGCASSDRTTVVDEGTGGHKIKVVSTVFPGYDFARAVAGDRADVNLLLPPGSESHSFEPTPKDIIAIQSCDLFLYVGGESDTWVNGILESMDTSGMTILPMMDCVEIVEEEVKEGMECSNEGEEGEYDEHVWTSPVNAMRISQAIADALAVQDEQGAEIYRANSEAYIEALGALDAEFRSVVQQAERRTLIFGDRFPFRYFTEEYGLDYYAAFPGCAAETEASAKTVAFLIDKVRAEQIPAVLHIEFSNEKMADAICEATGAQKLLLHSCHNVTQEQLESGVTYLALMEGNAETLRQALN